MLLGHGRADTAGRSADDGARLAPQRVSAVRAARPIDRILQRTRYRPVVLRSDNEDHVLLFDAPLELKPRRRIVVVVVPAVERNLVDGDFLEAQLLRREFLQRAREATV